MHRSDFSRSRAVSRESQAFALLSDRMAAHTSPWAIGTATVVNGSIVALFILLGMKAAITHFAPSPNTAPIHISDLPIFAPRPASNGGNGGGSNDPVPPTEGRTPPYSATPLAPPIIPVIVQPKLAEESTIAIRLPDDSTMPSIGVHGSTNATLLSSGPGGPNGIGTGKNGEYGPGNGDRLAGAPGTASASSIPASPASLRPRSSSSVKRNSPTRRAAKSIRASALWASSSTRTAIRKTCTSFARSAWASTKRPSKPSANTASSPAPKMANPSPSRSRSASTSACSKAMRACSLLFRRQQLS